DWDGGFTMPGESLSRYRDKAPAKPEPVVEASTVTAGTAEAEEPVANSTDVTEVHLGTALAEEPTLGVTEGVQELPSAGSPEPWVAALTEPEATEPPAAIYTEPEIAKTAALKPEHRVEAAEEEIHEEVHEFEPESASASHRVYPAGPSEFRVA